MPRFIIDENLPYHFSLWHGTDFIHVFDLQDKKTDAQIWNYAKLRNLTIITKNADFSNRIMFSQPPPKVIHLKVGN